MCCFSQPVISVSSTNIFARTGEGERQFLVYSMSIRASKNLAMILPLPVKTNVGEKDVEFIDLKAYPNFFTDLNAGFPPPGTPKSGTPTLSASSDSSGKLEVFKVGDFEASFVPNVNDFSRLDERFRLPTNTWSKLPDYQSYGFAVFKLKPKAITVHPMAFSFPRRYARSLFFPTVHIHDGKVHQFAPFDHSLYCQPRESQQLRLQGWQESQTHAKNFMQIAKTKGIVEGEQHAYLRDLRGDLPNRDTFVGITA